MKKLALLMLTALAVCCPCASWAYTVTFDDIPTGQDLRYYWQQYGLRMLNGWQVIDSAASGWGTPQSGTQSVIWNGNPDFAAGLGFGTDGVPSSEYNVRYVGAYFTTAPGTVLEMRGYTGKGVITTIIGDRNGSWTNHYAAISSATDAIEYVHIHYSGSVSPDPRYHFSMDDLTIVPVPEPSSVVVLVGGLASVAGAMWRRQRKS